MWENLIEGLKHQLRTPTPGRALPSPAGLPRLLGGWGGVDLYVDLLSPSFLDEEHGAMNRVVFCLGYRNQRMTMQINVWRAIGCVNCLYLERIRGG